ncbi:LCP family protein [Stackebrandtia soli]|uniref:LCP family protein n=1 Tax=Stackebrandtia soli TaxID=1892856 RepID=UPI0039E7F89F
MSKSLGDSGGSETGRSPLWAKFMTGIGALLMVVAGGTVVYANTLLDQINNSVEPVDLLGDGDVDTSVPIEGPLNLLMIGTDLRYNDEDGLDRADSIMILHINKDLTKATIVSVPRDLKVDIPKCDMGWTSPCNYKVNASYTFGGEDRSDRFQNLASTLSELTGIERFDGAAIVGFKGFLKAVKVFGTVELCLPIDMYLEQERLENNGVSELYPKGCNEYNQQKALYIVRERYAYDPTNPDFDPEYGVGDYGRQHMQQHFIKQLLKRADERGYVTDPTKVGTVIQAVGESLTLDLNGRTPVDFAVAMRHIQPSALQTIRLPSHSENLGGESFEVITPDSPEAEQTEALWAALRNDTLDAWIAANPDLINKD